MLPRALEPLFLQEEIKSAMSSIANFIAKLMQIERRKDGRVAARSVEAFHKAAREEKPIRIKDISATGIYLITTERWPLESNVSVILRRKRLFGNGETSQVQMKAQVARWGEDGVGLTFVHDSNRVVGADGTIWHRQFAP